MAIPVAKIDSAEAASAQEAFERRWGGDGPISKATQDWIDAGNFYFVKVAASDIKRDKQGWGSSSDVKMRLKEPISQETKAKIDANYRKMAASESFDADVMDDLPYHGMRLMDLTLSMEDLICYSKAAIDSYNSQLKLVQVVNADWGMVKDYNITFTANSDSAPTHSMYQAKVRYQACNKPLLVNLVRPAPHTYSS